jgi:hypothetical protein
MTKKDYIVIARAIHELYREENGALAQKVINKLGGHLLADNPKFDCVRFERACIEGVVTERWNTKIQHMIG